MSAADSLRGVALFAGLDDASLAELAAIARPFTAAAGTELFQQGDDADALYVLGAGRVRVSARVGGDEEVRVAELGPGDVLGEMALIDGGPRSASAVCEEATSGWQIGRLHFEAVLWLGMRPVGFEIKRRLLRVACERLAAVTDDIAELVDAADAATPDPGGPPPPRADDAPGPASGLDRAVLVRLPFFSSFNDAQLAELLALAVRREVPRGRMLFDEGDPAPSLFMVVRGAVQVTLHRGDAAEKLALLGPGQVFGHMALVLDGARTARCTAREQTVLLELPRSGFEQLLADRTAAGQVFVNALCSLLADALRRSGRQLARLAAEGQLPSGS